LKVTAVLSLVPVVLQEINDAYILFGTPKHVTE